MKNLNIVVNSELKITTHQDEEKLRENQELKLKYAAIVMDRFFLWVSSVYAVITFFALVIIIPNASKS